MFIISKTIKGKEFVYSNKYSILCKDKEQADMLANFMNSHNDTTTGDFKLKENEIWHTYTIDMYDNQPRYKLINTKGKISIREIL